MTTKFRFVCATRETYDDFFRKTALGRSLSIYRTDFAELTLFDTNTSGLPALYNEALRDAASDPAILIFIHDDVHLCDFFWHVHLRAGLKNFDVVGVAGNRRRVPRQPSWRFVDEKLTPDTAENLSGLVAHGKGFPPTNLSSYGPPAQQVKLLDGVLLAARSEVLRAKKIEFDERFDFHFYDMDFCRQVEASRLRMGTWPLSVIHESEGHFGSPAWQRSYARYLEKWKS
jgi:GT2 family glycosyltransferase